MVGVSGGVAVGRSEVLIRVERKGEGEICLRVERLCLGSWVDGLVGGLVWC